MSAGLIATTFPMLAELYLQTGDYAKAIENAEKGRLFYSGAMSAQIVPSQLIKAMALIESGADVAEA